MIVCARNNDLNWNCKSSHTASFGLSADVVIITERNKITILSSRFIFESFFSFLKKNRKIKFNLSTTHECK